MKKNNYTILAQSGEFTITIIASNLDNLNSVASVLTKMGLRRYTDTDENEESHIVKDVDNLMNHVQDNNAIYLGIDQWGRKVFVA